MANLSYTLPHSDAHLRLYKKLYLWNKDAKLRPGRAYAYLDRARYGMPPYHCQLNVAMKSQPLPLNVVNGGGRWAIGFLPPHNDHARYWQTMQLGQSMTFARDKALVRTRQHQAVTAGDRPLAGTVTAGQFVNRDRAV